MVDKKNRVTVILLAGGCGTRMQASMPKQLLLLGGKRVIDYSLEVFSSLEEVVEIIVVCESRYRDLIQTQKYPPPIHFASAGERRQDSVISGVMAANPSSTLYCIHDAARPFPDPERVKEAIQTAENVGAALLATPVTNTIKMADDEGMIDHTPNRKLLWNAQTPQILRSTVMQRGIAEIQKHNITITDDVSLAEIVGLPVKIVEGNPDNIKLTTPEDFSYAEFLLQKLPHENRLRGNILQRMADPTR